MHYYLRYELRHHLRYYLRYGALSCATARAALRCAVCDGYAGYAATCAVPAGLCNCTALPVLSFLPCPALCCVAIQTAQRWAALRCTAHSYYLHCIALCCAALHCDLPCDLFCDLPADLRSFLGCAVLDCTAAATCAALCCAMILIALRYCLCCDMRCAAFICAVLQ